MDAEDGALIVVFGIVFVIFLFWSGILSFEDTDTGSITSSTSAMIKEAIDYENPYTRDFAVSQVKHSGEYRISQICDLWESIYKKWTYVSDPAKKGYFSPASRTISVGLKGDCDDFAIVTAAAIQAVGGSSRVMLTQTHAYPEVMIASSKSQLQSHANYLCKRYNCKTIAYHTETRNGKNYYWLNLDWSAKHPGGPFKSGEVIAAVYPK